VGSLDHLWAGWRSEFVGAAGPATAGPAVDAADKALDHGRPAGAADCVFCGILASGLPDEEVHIVWRHPGGRVFAILNAYPYTSGHLMVMPVRHVADLEEFETGESAALWEGVSLGVRALKAAYKPEGINIGANVGRAAGAGVLGHFHMHVVPRWVGDANFMTSVADARVLPEPLVESAAKLRSAWPR
jgi:diadenosine tetraphosphate (Ap4A) HIT family hydrolase